MGQETLTVFPTGAERSEDAGSVRFDLLSPIALMAWAKTAAEGADKYGDYNWEKGMPAHDSINHALRHIYMHLAGDDSEPHLAHAMWNIAAAIHSMELWPSLNESHRRGPGCTITQVINDRLAGEDDDRRFMRDMGAMDAIGRWSLDDLEEVRRLRRQRQVSPNPIHVFVSDDDGMPF